MKIDDISIQRCLQKYYIIILDTILCISNGLTRRVIRQYIKEWTQMLKSAWIGLKACFEARGNYLLPFYKQSKKV